MGLAVQMPVIALLHLVFAQQTQNLRAVVPLIERRIVQEAQNLPVPRLPERRLEPPDLAQEHLFVVSAVVIQLIKPAARAAEGIVAVGQAVVVQNLHRVQPVRVEKSLHLRHRRPPVVVVALEQDFFAGDAVDKAEILQRFLKAHPPREVAAQDGHVVLVQVGKALLQPLDIVLPRLAEHVHGLVRREREVQVADCVQCHILPRFLKYK